MEAVVALPLVLPPTVLGFYILLAIGPHSPAGQLYAALTGGMLPFSFQGLLLASVLYSLPFAVQPFASGFAAVDRRLIEASWCLGVSRVATFFRVVAPLSLPSIVTGHDSELCAYAGRIRRGADGGRQFGGRHAHRVDLHLRRRAVAELQRRHAHFAAAAGDFVFGAGGHLWAAAAGLGGLARYGE